MSEENLRTSGDNAADRTHLYGEHNDQDLQYDLRRVSRTFDVFYVV